MGAHCEDIGESIEDLCDSDGTDEFSLTIKKEVEKYWPGGSKRK